MGLILGKKCNGGIRSLLQEVESSLSLQARLTNVVAVVQPPWITLLWGVVGFVDAGCRTDHLGANVTLLRAYEGLTISLDRSVTLGLEARLANVMAVVQRCICCRTLLEFLIGDQVVVVCNVDCIAKGDLCSCDGRCCNIALRDLVEGRSCQIGSIAEFQAWLTDVVAVMEDHTRTRPRHSRDISDCEGSRKDD